LSRLAQDVDGLRSTEEGVEAGVIVCKIFSAAEDSLAAGVDFIRYPWYRVGAREVVDFLGPCLQRGSLG
jgi:hypothetical protein